MLPWLIRWTGRFALAVTLLAAALWARSYRFADGLHLRTGAAGGYLITTESGRLCTSWPSPVSRDTTSTRGLSFLVVSARRVGPRERVEGDSSITEDQATAAPRFRHGADVIGTSTTQYLEIPLSLLVAGGAAVFLACVALGTLRERLLRRRRGRAGRCRDCGYDLRASTRCCPECGRDPTAPARRPRARIVVAGSLIALSFAGVSGWFRGHDFHPRAALALDFATPGGFLPDPDHAHLADVPSAIRALDGQRVSITGMMIPMDQPLHEFALVPNLSRFRPPPDVTQVVVCRLPRGGGTPYVPDRLRVSGTLHVRTTMDDGYLVSLYELDVEHVEPVH